MAAASDIRRVSDSGALMAKGEGVAPPTCKNCGEAHWREPGKVCPKFRSPTKIKQPVPLRLPPPPKDGTAPPAVHTFAGATRSGDAIPQGFVQWLFDSTRWAYNL